MKRRFHAFFQLATTLVVFGLSLSLHAQPKEAAFNGYCHSFRFLVGTASSAGLNFEMFFTSYDGGASTLLYDTDSLGYATFSDELLPSFSELGVYRTDYALYVNKKYNAAGTISATFPTVDSDQNGIADFLQKNKQVNSSVSGKLLRQLPSLAPEIVVSGQIVRSAGSSQGTYSFTGRDPEVGNITYRGDLYLVNLLGKLKYNPSSSSVTIEADLEREGGAVLRYTSTLNYSITDVNKISFPAGKFTNPNLPDSFTKAFVLKRTGNRYLGRLEFVDAFRGTSWPDYTAWQLEIVDTNDSDRDGVPDLSDPPIVQSPPTISVQPVSQTRTVGEAVSLTVQALGSGALSYSWRKNGVPVLNVGGVSGVNGPTLSFASLQTSHAGAYSVVVSNLVGSVTSSVAQLTVNSADVPPTIVVQPVSAAVRVGQQVTLSVQAAGTPTPSFQWQRNGANLPGATSAEWVIRSATLNDAGEYRVVVANSSGTVTSAPAFVAVLAPDYLPAITQQPQGTNLLVGQRLELRVIATGNPEPAYLWRKDGVQLPAGSGPVWTKPSVTMADAGVYQVIVSNSVGAVFSAQASVVVVPETVVPRIIGFREIGGGDLDFDVDAAAGREWVLEDSRILGNWSEVARFMANQQRFSLRVPYQSSNSRFFRLRQAGLVGKGPVITLQPRDLTVWAGSNAVFTVVAEGTPPLSYQWFFNGTVIPGSGQSTLILANIQATNTGDYQVVVSNSVGTVTGSLAKLTVEAGKPIGTEDFVWIPPGMFVMGSPFGEPGRGQDENLHSVILTRGFWISDHEVTQGEYEVLMGNNPSTFRGDPDLPVESVTWHDAVNYCSRLTERERSAGRITAQQAYRLPTEAEWEYSARSGTTSLRYGNLMDIAWYSDNSGGKSQPVRQKIPNNWGLYDMLGNVAEWCSDRKGAYPSGTVTDPEALNLATTARVIRGGYFVLGGGACRSAARFSSGPSDSGNGVGFRPVLSLVR